MKLYDPGIRAGSFAPREDAKTEEPPEQKTVPYGEAAATEIAKYGCRLNAKDLGC